METKSIMKLDGKQRQSYIELGKRLWVIAKSCYSDDGKANLSYLKIEDSTPDKNNMVTYDVSWKNQTMEATFFERTQLLTKLFSYLCEHSEHSAGYSIVFTGWSVDKSTKENKTEEK